jgi:[acyl-carrier-protein] S-malonyltransferase
VERAADLAKQRGAKKAVMLVVSAPFHCALMQPAQDRLEQDLQALHFSNPEVPVICNIDATPKTTVEGSRQALVRQVTGAVQWAKSMQTLIELGVKTFIEVGPGKVLMGLMRQIDRSQTCLASESEPSLLKLTEHFAAAAKQ